ncbi:hypothetical protein PMIN01_11886 [Paraphaeosphaeria minitans]|uniref:Uncharacterized protein n=1 Tax=Paraphaeosphaeria minitans TaxID=565426 RepID=A0A9P6KK07_9PLEO|nr:hypothetical protein PMIN01_11886 [Paraphaeosphaeria minitans]
MIGRAWSETYSEAIDSEAMAAKSAARAMEAKTAARRWQRKLQRGGGSETCSEGDGSETCAPCKRLPSAYKDLPPNNSNGVPTLEGTHVTGSAPNSPSMHKRKTKAVGGISPGHAKYRGQKVIYVRKSESGNRARRIVRDRASQSAVPR